MPTPEIKQAIANLIEATHKLSGPPDLEKAEAAVDAAKAEFFEDGLPQAEAPTPAPIPAPVLGEAQNPLAALGRPYEGKSQITPYMRGLEPWPSGPYKGQYRKVVQD